MTLAEIIALGGVFMWPLIAFFIIMIYAVIERTITLIVTDLRIDADYIRRQLHSDEMADYGRNKYYPILTENYRMFRDNADLFDRYMTSECQKLADNLNRNMSLISIIGVIAPVTGFLGTVVGMIDVFRSINAASDVSAQLVAGGIYEALITTAAGLIISIVASIAYYILHRFIDDYIRRMEYCTNAVMKMELTDEIANRSDN